MTIPEMFVQSTALTVVGMTMVFGFLIIMIISVIVTGKIIHAVGADKDVQPSSQASAPAAASDAGAITAVISAAVTEHRKKS